MVKMFHPPTVSIFWILSDQYIVFPIILHQTDKSKVSLSKLKLQHLKYLSIFDNGKINWIISFNREAHCRHIVIQFNLI